MDSLTFINDLASIGWKTSVKPVPSFNLSPSVLQRYPELPDEVVDFLSHVEFCSNPEETAWFLAEVDYNGRRADSAFRWNEFEEMSLEAAAENPEWGVQISSWWDAHFPIMFSVKSGYAFVAVSLLEDSFGSIVYGEGPEFEAISKVSSTFSGFCELLLRDLRGEGTNWMLARMI